MPISLIGRDAGAHAAAADEHAAVGFFIEDGAADGFGEVRIIGGIFVEGADVENFLAERAQQRRPWRLSAGNRRDQNR